MKKEAIENELIRLKAEWYDQLVIAETAQNSLKGINKKIVALQEQLVIASDEEPSEEDS